MLFQDRADAGRILASKLTGHKDRTGTLILALPRGGVPVAREISRALNLPIDVFVVRKLGVPGHEELAMGAIASGGSRFINDEVVEQLGITSETIEAVAAREYNELLRRERLYRGGRSAPDIHNKIVILVDDGLATGSSMRAAIRAIRQQHPTRILVAVPTAAAETCDTLRKEVDEVVCPDTPEPFYAVGASYRRFDQITDEEVRDLLLRAA